MTIEVRAKPETGTKEQSTHVDGGGNVNGNSGLVGTGAYTADFGHHIALCFKADSKP